MTAQKIYFDESGYTGNNLLHKDQHYFCYASVATDDEEAAEFVSERIKFYRLQCSELKGSKLMKTANGRRLIDDIFTRFDGRIKAVAANKRYALACKVFEYVFEPCIAEQNSLYYRLGFHEYIANLMFAELKYGSPETAKLFSDFEETMRARTLSEGLFNIDFSVDEMSPLRLVAEFARLNRQKIEAEISSLPGEGFGKWILELTHTSAFNMLSKWGLKYPLMTAVCDDSKSLLSQTELYDEMVGHTRPPLQFEAFGKSAPLGFNLSGPIEFRSSEISHGIQIADSVAAAMVHVFIGNDEHSKKWKGELIKYGEGSILPDPYLLNAEEGSVARNQLILIELHKRSQNQQSLIEGMPEFVALATQFLKTQGLQFE